MLPSRIEPHVTTLARTANIIWAAFMAGPVIYAVMLYVSSTLSERAAAPAGLGLLELAPLLAAGWALIAIYRQRTILSDERLRDEIARPEDLAGVRSQLEPSVSLDGLDPTELRLLALAGFIHRQSLICWAFSESVAIMGLVVAFLTASPETILVYSAAAVALIAWMRPRLVERLTEAARWPGTHAG